MDFSIWLIQQCGRDDIVGDLAKDAKLDTPRPRSNYSAWRGYLIEKRACKGALEALEEAWTEYHEYRRTYAPQELIYFLHAPRVNWVKIGWTNNIQKRLAAISSACPLDVHLVHTMPGGKEKEAELHFRFDRFRQKGEWFHFCGSMRIALAQMGGPDLTR